MMENKLIVTIDGPAGSGKTTVAKRVAERLKFFYLDTGAMYRAVTLKVLKKGLKPQDEEMIVKTVEETVLEIKKDEEKGLKIWLDGEDVTDKIREEEVTNNVWWVCRIPEVRERMKELQREMGKNGKIVVEGRDIGTVVFPDAPFKFYLDASLDERTRRRWFEEKEKGVNSDRRRLKEEIEKRDKRDMSREVAPLKKAPDAIYIDTTSLSIEEVVERILAHIKRSKVDGI